MRKFEMTKAEMFATVMAWAIEREDDNITQMIQHEIDLLNKRATRTSKKSDANELLADRVIEVLKEIQASEMTCTEILQACNFDEIKSTSKMSAVIRKLVDRGDVIREVQGKKAVFSLA